MVGRWKYARYVYPAFSIISPCLPTYTRIDMQGSLVLVPTEAVFEAAYVVPAAEASEVVFVAGSVVATAAQLPVGTSPVKTCMLTTQALIKQVRVQAGLVVVPMGVVLDTALDMMPNQASRSWFAT